MASGGLISSCGSDEDATRLVIETCCGDGDDVVTRDDAVTERVLVVRLFFREAELLDDATIHDVRDTGLQAARHRSADPEILVGDRDGGSEGVTLLAFGKGDGRRG